MSKYLYGASVQGIQEFIFKTNQLQEIVGASEIVKSLEAEFVKFTKIDKKNILLNAAGNIKAIFEDKTVLEKVVLEFPKMIMQKAYGITISQAVVKLRGETPTQDEINELEKKLKIQRNKPSLALDSSLNIMQLAPKTARPIVKYKTIKKQNVPLDMASDAKLQANEEFYKKNPRNKEFTNISDFSNGKSKIAIVHIDGNGLGQLIPNLKIPLNEFSLKLDEATREAFEEARDSTMSVREVILGGDDVTVICNANDALTFTQKFLQLFEEKTAEKLSNKLTACAGIAYCNEKYPFHYAVSLAEALCSQTKKHAKKINPDLAPSSLMFHNIQSSNFQTWEKFVKDELTIQNDNDRETVKYDFGPYYLSEEIQPGIEKFLISVEAYRCDGSPISRLRSWLSELGKSSQSSKNLLSRINKVTQQSDMWKCDIMNKNLENLHTKLSDKDLIIEKDGFYKTPIYDILQIHSVTEAKK